MFLPRVRQTITKEFTAPSPKSLAKGARESSASASVKPDSASLTFQHYSDSAALFGEHMSNTELIQILFEDESKRSLWFAFDTDIYNYLAAQKREVNKEAAEDSDDEEKKELAQNWPVNEMDLAVNGILLRKTTNDPMKVGMRKWQLVMYVDGGHGGMLNAMRLLDGYMCYRVTQSDFTREKPTVIIYNSTGYSLDEVISSSKYKNLVIKQEVPDHLHWFCAVPPNANTILKMHVYPVSEEEATFFWEGNTYPFSENCQSLGIEGAYFNPAGEKVDGYDKETIKKEGLRYWRFVERLNLKMQEADFARMLGEGCFRRTAMQVKLHDVNEDSIVFNFLKQLSYVQIVA